MAGGRDEVVFAITPHLGRATARHAMAQQADCAFPVSSTTVRLLQYVAHL